MKCRHIAYSTTRRIQATFAKGNLKPGEFACHTTGTEAVCARCGARLIIHDDPRRFSEKATALEVEK